jgi:hypothetical protein
MVKAPMEGYLAAIAAIAAAAALAIAGLPFWTYWKAGTAEAARSRQGIASRRTKPTRVHHDWWIQRGLLCHVPGV